MTINELIRQVAKEVSEAVNDVNKDIHERQNLDYAPIHQAVPVRMEIHFSESGGVVGDGHTAAGSARFNMLA